MPTAKRGDVSAAIDRVIADGLEIAPDARPGDVPIELMDGTQRVLRHPYPLQARAPGSAQRRGFGPQDVLVGGPSSIFRHRP